MRRIVVFMQVSLDGYIAGPDGDLSWNRVDDELHAEFNGVLGGMSAFLQGRVVHELMADHWPTADSDPDATPTVVEFAAIWRDMPKFVYSTTLTTAAWSTAVVARVDRDEVLALKAQPGSDMCLGGADLAASFQALGLVDEYRLYLHPVAIGAGKPLFPPGRHVDLRLVESQPLSNGVVRLRYDTGLVGS